MFLAEHNSPFAHWSAAQDVTMQVAPKTTFTLGTRYARYFGNTDVTFVSGSARRYFKGGAIAYRLTWTKPDHQNAYLAHLASLTLNDRASAGKTQVWLSYGAASLAASQVQDTFKGHDMGAVLMRSQPLSDSVSAVVTAGISSYDRRPRRATATTFGLGLSVRL